MYLTNECWSLFMSKYNLLFYSVLCWSVLSHFSCVQLFTVPWTVAHQAPLSVEFSIKYTGVGSRSLLQAISSTQVSRSASRFFTWWLTYSAKLLQSCPTLCNPMDCSLPGSSVHGILQARIPEWVAVSFSIIYSRCLLF